MKKTALTTILGLGLPIALAVGGCSFDAESVEAPDVDLDGLEGKQLVTSVNVDGTWTANASATAPSAGTIQGSTTFTGPVGTTRKMGFCLVRRHLVSVACSTTDDCANAPTSLPSGGSRYCIAANGSGQKYCHYRPGAASTYCAGSPVTGAPIAPGTYAKTSSSQPKGSAWVSYACFEGCAFEAGSVSGTELVF